MSQVRRDHAWYLAPGGLVVAALVVLVIGYARVRDEIQVAAQLPYLLTGGIGALVLTALGMVVLRAHHDGAVCDQLGLLEETSHELRGRVDYLSELLEAAFLPDNIAAPAAPCPSQPPTVITTPSAGS